MNEAPLHIAIIMDGNGRWAQKRGLPRVEGHRKGLEVLSRILKSLNNQPIRCLTLFAFSSENWQRPRAEVDALMKLLPFGLKQYSATLVKERIGLRVLGRLQELPYAVQKALNKTLESTAAFTERIIAVALNYSSRNEIIDAVKHYTQAVREGMEDPKTLSWDVLSRYLYTASLPDPDVIIRTSGENRLSNFLLLQSAYAEMYFTPTLWPDFTPEELDSVIEDYKKRERRFGKITQQHVAAQSLR